MPRVRAITSGRVIPRKKTAIAKAAACPSLIEPSVIPATKNAISWSVSAWPSRLARMISCGSIC